MNDFFELSEQVYTSEAEAASVSEVPAAEPVKDSSSLVKTIEHLEQSAARGQRVWNFSVAIHDDECAICNHGLYGKSLLSLACGHILCLGCYSKLRKRCCPYCRKPIKA